MRVIEANDQQRIERDKICFLEWGQLLSQDQFLRREQTLHNHVWAKSAKKTWLLVNDSGDILSSCETFEMKSRWRGQVGVSYGFASVVTEAALRGHGYARKLIDLVVEAITRREPKVQCFHLISEVDPKIYSSVGFTIICDKDWTFPPAKLEVNGSVLPVKFEHLDGVLKHVSNGDEFQIMATPRQFDWHFERMRFYETVLGRKQIDQIGVSIGSSVLIWTVDLKEDILRALFFLSTDEAEARHLIQAAQTFVQREGLNELRLWDCENSTMLSSLGGTSGPINDGPLMARPAHDDGIVKQWKSANRVIWV